jgi:hypothetical protein
VRTTTLAIASVGLLCVPAAAAQERPRATGLVRAGACGQRMLATASTVAITPNGDGVADCAAVRVRLERPARLELVVSQRKPQPGAVHVQRIAATRGVTTLVWTPGPTTAARTYVTRVGVIRAGTRVTIAGPVIRVRGIHARFARESYAPGDVATLRIDSPARSLTLRVVDVVADRPVSPSRRVELHGATTVGIRIGTWRPGVYAAELERDGVASRAPLVVRAPRTARPRVGVVLPTTTWEAYNLTDGDGDGTGDSWYATRRRESARLGRPFLGDGMPPRFRRDDLPFLRWLRSSERRADFLTDADLEQVPSAEALARRYDLLVFPGHHEYVTWHEFDLIRGYRDLGGNLVFLAADNLHWRVVRVGSMLRRKEQWRSIGRPEAAVTGVQYRANDHGTRGAYVVRDTRCAPWLFRATRLRVGSRFGWSGVEIDATTGDSPPRTCVVAEIPHLLGRARTAQMTYYETSGGAKVFAAGAFSLPSGFRVMRVMLDNLWARLSRP